MISPFDLRTYYDSETNSYILMYWDPTHNGWMPHMPTMTAFRDGQLRTFLNPRGGSILSLPDTLEPADPRPNGNRWPIMSQREQLDIRGIVSEPWISMHATFKDFSEDEAADVFYRMAAGDYDPRLEKQLRPVLFHPEPYVIQMVAPPPKPVPLPRHIADAAIAHAIATRATCPITFRPITEATSTVTSCGHCFDSAAIASWLERHITCPQCRQICTTSQEETRHNWFG